MWVGLLFGSRFRRCHEVAVREVETVVGVAATAVGAVVTVGAVVIVNEIVGAVVTETETETETVAVSVGAVAIETAHVVDPMTASTTGRETSDEAGAGHGMGLLPLALRTLRRHAVIDRARARAHARQLQPPQSTSQVPQA